MLAVAGTYSNGSIKLDTEYISNKPIKVIVTFLEDLQTESEKGMLLSDFSFSKSQEISKNFKGSFSDTVIAERRSEQ
jgi:hypothetical protein